jgi:uncharacterized protein (TIGR03435 family)
VRTILPLLLIFQAFELAAQSPPAPRALEVASIRPHPDPVSHIDITIAGPRLEIEAYFVPELIMEAYNIKNYQISLAPNVRWPGTRYDIVAKAEGDGAPTREEFREMLRTLLADRFKLKLHREAKEMQVYALVVGKNGPKLKPSAPDANPIGRGMVNGRNYEITRPKADMDAVVQAISNAFLDRPVVDRTGLTGTYDLKLTYTPDTPANRLGEPDPNDISIFTAVREQLGMALEPQRAAVETLVIDHVEQPSEN